jgi:hypothetical protein
MGTLNKDLGKVAQDSFQSSPNYIEGQYEIPIDDPNQVALHKEML